MPEAYPLEFRERVVRAVLEREPGVTQQDVANAFDVHVGTIAKWMRKQPLDAERDPPRGEDGAADLHVARRRVAELEQENGLLRQALVLLAQAGAVRRP